jgi:hypothetical protein
MKSGLSRTRLAVLLGLAMAWNAPSAWAQAVYGSIAGTVEDSTGAAVPGASVTIKSLERQTEDTVTTNESGRYGKDRLLPGTYTVRAELSGFKPKVVSRAVVNVDTQTKVDFSLEVGGVTEEVTVTSAEGQLLKTDRADVAVTFDNKQVTELPVLDRNFTKFILLTPGTQQQSWNHAASENPQGSAQTVVNGQTFSGTGYQLDGTENRDPILGIIVINPNLEAIGETKITSQNYDAEFGQAIAGVVSVQTKSGTNDIHGSAFEFLQRDTSSPTVHNFAEDRSRQVLPESAGPVRRLDRRTDPAECGSFTTTRTCSTRRLRLLGPDGRGGRRPERVRRHFSIQPTASSQRSCGRGSGNRLSQARRS